MAAARLTTATQLTLLTRSLLLQSFKREAQRQGVQFLLMVVVALVTMFFLGIGPFEPGGVLSKEGFANLFGASAAAAPVDAGRSEL